MKQILTTAFFILCISSIALAQKTTGKLLFEQGQTLEITLQSKTTISQQAMGQAIDFMGWVKNNLLILTSLKT